MADEKPENPQGKGADNTVPDSNKVSGIESKADGLRGAASDVASKTIQDSIKNPAAAKVHLAKNVAGKAMEGTAVGDAAEQATQVIDKGTKVAQAASQFGSALSSFVSSLFSPFTWVIIAVSLVIVLVISSVQVIGQNENANGCAGIGGANAVLPGTVATTGGAVNIEQARNQIGAWLMSTSFKSLGNKPMTKEQAAAFVGNWQQESGLDPSASFGNVWKPTSTNAEVLAVGASQQPATGLAQWAGGRRLAMVKSAAATNKNWNDLGAQLTYFKTEFDGSEGAGLESAGFNDAGKSVADLAGIVVNTFERSGEHPGEAGYDNRIKNAQAFMTTFKGGSALTVTTGGSCLMDSGGSFDASGVVKLAEGIAYPYSQYLKSKVAPGDPTGILNALPAYKAAKAAAEKKGGVDGYQPTLYASCDRFVATVMKNTIDTKIPWGSTTEQHAYLVSSPNWKVYHSKAEAKPGDIWVTRNNGHIVIYIGMYQGMDSIASASFQDRVAAIGDAGYLNANLIDTEGRPYDGFHYIGPGSSGTGIITGK